MWKKLKQIWHIKPLRKSIGFVLLMLVLFRLLAHVPIPGIDAAVVRGVLDGNQFLGLLNIFSGGTLESFSVVALGVAPFITSSIVFQLLTMVVPKLERMQKEEGEAGRQKINQWTRWCAVPLAIIQGYGFVALISQQSGGLLLQGFDLVMALIVMTAGTIFLMWVGELISEKGIGNGLSIMILAGIIASVPQFIAQTAATTGAGQIINIVVFVLLMLVTIVAVATVNEATRNIPVNYARHHSGGRLAGRVATDLPLRVVLAGVIPIIFAISIILFPTMVAQFLQQARSPMLVDVANWIIVTFQNQWFYGILYFILVFLFTYFYTGVIFRPDDMAENLQKQGAFIPGVRPGKPTEEYLQTVMNRILLIGASFLAVVAILPLIIQPLLGSASSQSFIGGTTMLIIVAVIIDIVKQTEAQITSYEYEQF